MSSPYRVKTLRSLLRYQILKIFLNLQ